MYLLQAAGVGGGRAGVGLTTVPHRLPLTAVYHTVYSPWGGGIKARLKLNKGMVLVWNKSFPMILFFFLWGGGGDWHGLGLLL